MHDEKHMPLPRNSSPPEKTAVPPAAGRVPLHLAAGIFFTVLFSALLAFRVGFFSGSPAPPEGRLPGEVHHRTDRESWMSLFLQGQRIGYAHRRLSGTTHGYRVLETVFMRVNTMGLPQDLRFKTEANLLPDMSLSSFEFDLQSNLFRFRAVGIREGTVLTLMTGPERLEKRTRIELPRDLYLNLGLTEAFLDSGTGAGDSKTFLVYDPATSSQRPVQLTLLCEESIVVSGEGRKARKVAADFMGTSQYAWIDEDGTLLREEGPLGLTLVQVTREEALRDLPPGGTSDITRLASIPSGRRLEKPSALEELSVRIDGIVSGAFDLDGGRQSLEGSVLRVRKESLPERSPLRLDRDTRERLREFLSPEPLIQSDHRDIAAQVRDIVSPGDDMATKARKITRWVHRNIEKRPVLSVPNALETLTHRRGDCNEHAVLLAALARAEGIPAQVEAGLVYMDGRFYYHAWNALYPGRWVTADSSLGQIPADVTHIRLLRGTGRQVDLVGVIGKLKLEIVDEQRH